MARDQVWWIPSFHGLAAQLSVAHSELAGSRPHHWRCSRWLAAASVKIACLYNTLAPWWRRWRRRRDSEFEQSSIDTNTSCMSWLPVTQCNNNSIVSKQVDRFYVFNYPKHLLAKRAYYEYRSTFDLKQIGLYARITRVPFPCWVTLQWLVSWSLTSLFNTNMAMSETTPCNVLNAYA